MSKACWQNVIVDEEGNILPGALVEVRDAETNNLVSLYEDRDGLVGQANPVQAPTLGDDAGFVRFFVTEGTYKLTVTATGYARTYEYVPIFATTNSGDSSGYLSVAIASGNVDNWAPVGLDNSTGVLDVNPSSGNAVLRGIDASLLRDGQELTLTNVHASNTLELAILNAGSAAANQFRGYAAGGNVTLLQDMSVTVKKSAGAARLIIKL